MDPVSKRNRDNERGAVRMGILIGLGVVAALAVGGMMTCSYTTSTFNGLVEGDQKVKAQWSQVENVYQRRADLIPNLEETVKGAAAFERGTFTGVAEARAKVGQINVGKDLLTNPERFAQFQAAQGSLSSALSKLMVVIERYPDLKANRNFMNLMAQLEGTENRVAVERKRYNDAAKDFNTDRSQFPAVLIADRFGDRFAEKPYFKADEGAKIAPKINMASLGR
jgi:LemA protein